MFKSLILIDTENWQINYLAWLSMGKPEKVVLLSPSPNPESNPRLNTVKEFFERKGVSSYILHNKILPADPTEGPSIVEKAIGEHCASDERICLFRSGGTKLHSESFLLAALSLGRSSSWPDRLVLAASERDEAIIRLHTIRNGSLIPFSECPTVPFKGDQLELGDLSAISGCQLKPEPLPPPWFCRRRKMDEPPWEQRTRDVLLSESVQSSVFEWFIDWRRDDKARKGNVAKTSIAFETEAERHEAARKLLKALDPEFSMAYAGGFSKLEQCCLSTIAAIFKRDPTLTQLVGALFEKVITAAWLKNQLTKFLATGSSCRIWQGVLPVLAGIPTTDFDYFLLHDRGRSCILECKTDYRDLMPQTGFGKPSQSELQVRYADLLTGVQQRVVFLFPVQNENQYEEAMDEKAGIPAAYPDKLGFRAVPVRLDRFNCESRELRIALPRSIG